MLSKHSTSELMPNRVCMYMHDFETGPYSVARSGFEVHFVTQVGFELGIFLDPTLERLQACTTSWLNFFIL